MKNYFSQFLNNVKTVRFWIALIGVITLPLLRFYSALFIPDIVFIPLLTLLSTVLLFAFLGPARWFSFLVGNVNYNQPDWFSNLKSTGVKSTLKLFVDKMKEHKKTSATFATLLLAGISFLVWHFFIPKPPPPPSVSITVQSPSKTYYYLDSQKVEQKSISTLGISFSKGVAPLKLIGKELKEPPTLRPEIKGKWVWERDNFLRFTPEVEWEIGAKYKLSLRKNMLVGHYVYNELQHQFSIESFLPKIDGLEFYEDPRNPENRKVITTVNFNYPVDPTSVEQGISLTFVEYGKNGEVGRRKLTSKVIYDDLKERAYIHTDKINIPKEEGKVFVSLTGMKSSKGGDPYPYELKEDIRIPGVYDYFHIKKASIEVIPNQKDIPEHILVVSSSTGISPNEIKRKIKAYQLPIWDDRNGKKYRIYWQNKGVEEVQRAIGESKQLDLELLPSQEEFPKTFMFKVNPKVLSYVHVVVPKGLKSPSGFELQQNFSQTTQAKEFPKQLKISGEGNILSLEGERKLSVFSVNVEKFWLSIGQLLPGQIQHIVTQTYGDTTSGSWRDKWSFNEENITHLEIKERRVNKYSKTDPSYTVVDFSKYLNRYLNGKKPKGLFFVKVGQNKHSMNDVRLISVTDLGVFVKRDIKRNYNIFVQSLEDGGPVQGALVELIGKNGMPLLYQQTDERGHARFPKWNKLKGHPVAFVVRKGNDMTFMRLNDYNRSLNYSRFDVSGVRNEYKDDKIKSYIFSDRGTYRPGENVVLGFISKVKNWKTDLSNIPIEIVVMNSKGQKIIKEPLSLRENGLGEFTFDLSRNAPTGSYTVNLYNFYKNDRKRHQILMGSSTIKVQEFLPDRLKIRANLNKQKDAGWIDSSDLKGLVNLKNLFGKAAIGNRIKAKYQISPASFYFSKYSDFRFSNPSKEVSSHTEELGEKNTNDTGDVEFDIDLTKFSKNIFRLQFYAEGFEKESGRSVTAGIGTTVSPYKFLVGLKKDGDFDFIQPEEERTLSLISINSDLLPVDTKGLKYEIIEQKYVNILTHRANGTFGYESILKEEVVEKNDLSISKEGTKLNLRTDKSGDYLLRILNGDLLLGEVNYSVTGDRTLARGLSRNAELEAKLNKSDFNVGETIKLELKAPYLGQGLITIEKDKVYYHKWFTLNNKTQVLNIKVPEGIEGNAYVNVALVRSSESKEIYMSPLSYGAFPFTISKKSRTQNLHINFPEVTKSGSEFKVNYSADYEGEVILFAINEGILQFGKYQNPNPLGYFLTKKSLDVETWQLLDLLLPENSMVKQSLRMGGGDGDMASSQLNPFKRKLKKPVAYWSGIRKIDETVRDWKIQIPGDFNGQLRVMAISVARNRMGFDHKKGFVRSDLILSPTLPYFASPGETFPVNLNVFNNMPDDDKSHEVKVNLSSSTHFQVVGESTSKLNIDKNRDKTHIFTLKATDQLGSASIDLSASSKTSKNKISESMSLRPSLPYNSTIHLGILRDAKVNLPITRTLYPHHAKREVNISATPLSFARSLMKFLSNNPYGCSEQILSKAWPYVIFKDHSLTNGKKHTPEQFFRMSINMLRSRITGTGELQVYPGYNSNRPFLSIYLLHLLLEAKENNFVVSQDLIKSLSRFVKTEMKNFNNEREKAYAIYILSQHEEVVTPFLAEMEGTVQRLLKKDKLNTSENLILAYLAGSYASIQSHKKSFELINKANFQGERVWSGYSYYTDVQGKAQLFYVMGRHFKEKLEDLSTNDYVSLFSDLQDQLNTLSSAYAMMAISTYTKLVESEDGDFFSIRETRKDSSGKETDHEIKENENIDKQFFFSDLAKTIRIERKSDLPIYYSLVHGGFDRKHPGAMENQVEVYKKYLNKDGKEVSELTVGEEITVELSLRSKNNSTHSDMILVDLLPTGFENVLTEEGQPASEGGELHFADVREDRVLSYLDATPSTTKVQFKIKPTVPGSFILPAPLLENMYKREIRALGEEKRIVVKKP